MELNRYSKRPVETSTKQIISYFTSQQEQQLKHDNTMQGYHQRIFDYPENNNNTNPNNGFSFVPNCIQQPPSIPTLQNAWRKHNLPNFALTIKGVGGGGGITGNATDNNQLINQNQFTSNNYNSQHNQYIPTGGSNHQFQYSNTQYSNHSSKQHFQHNNFNKNSQNGVNSSNSRNNTITSESHQKNNSSNGSQRHKSAIKITKSNTTSEHHYNMRAGSTNNRISMSANGKNSSQQSHHRENDIKWGSAVASNKRYTNY